MNFKKNQKHDFPVRFGLKDDEFFKYSGGRLPAIVYIEDGVIKKKWFGDLFDVDVFRRNEVRLFGKLIEKKINYFKCI